MKIELVPPKAEHLSTVYSWRSEAACRLYNPLAEISYENFEKSHQPQTADLSSLTTQTSLRWVALLDGAVAGNINLNGINHMMHTAEIGYTVGEKFHGQGVATAMIRELLRKVFRETKLRKIFALVHEENLASCRVLEKLGFRREGLLREHYLINGKPVNEVFFGLLRSDWKE